MPATVEYYFTLVSPWTYMGDPILREICARHGATIKHVPVNFGRLLDSTGGLPLGKRSDQRKALRMQELRRWRDYRGIDLNLQPAFFPASDKAAAAMVIKAQQAGQPVGEFVYGVLRAVWAEERNVADPDTLVAIADASGLDGKALIAAAEDPAIEAAWETNTDTAIAKDVMGAPFYIVGEEKFWGQDRLDFVDRHLASL